MARITNRPPAYVPAGPVRNHLMAYSKAALAELVYDFAIQDLGGTSPDAVGDLYVIEQIRRRADAVTAAVFNARPHEDRTKNTRSAAAKTGSG